MSGSVSSENPASRQQQLQSRGSVEGLQRVSSPGPHIQFDAAAYAAAAAARTASPGDSWAASQWLLETMNYRHPLPYRLLDAVRSTAVSILLLGFYA